MDLIIGLVFNGGLLLTALFILFVNSPKIKKIIATILLCIYVVILAIGVFSDISIGDSIKVVFDFSGKWAQKDIIWSPIPESMWGFLTNITMLVPIGLYIGAICHKPLLKSIIIGFGTGLFIELMQFILPIPRFPQVSDIWLNGVSTILGCLYSMLFVWLKTKIHKKHNSPNKETQVSNPPNSQTITNTTNNTQKIKDSKTADNQANIDSTKAKTLTENQTPTKPQTDNITNNQTQTPNASQTETLANNLKNTTKV